MKGTLHDSIYAEALRILDILESAYISRLRLVADGKNHLPDIADVNTDSINAELHRILAQRDGLLQVIQELLLEICEPISQLKDYREALEAKGRWQVIEMLRKPTQISEDQDGLQYCLRVYPKFCVKSVQV